ncbi:hypothetical protein GA0074695_5231 [Micromonospora viridifaciens]|uniref:Uncharacterized protein n=1 Tax=Micromonospora viridifaciens TaxID=1881 RepID=A0A1C4Z8A7_MICVI|nr:hypothetical protein [Micromonospora viridifaciens]SCF29212.1 hypothetical protein GA0074695_5231 [Micromonospora viridifaciens]
MGVLVDYFAASTVELDRLDLSAGPAGSGWPHVDCKGWIDGLAGRIAELTSRDSSELGDDFVVSVEADGPWLTRVRPEVARALADVSDERLAEYVEDELLDEHEADRYVQLRDLARSAGANGRDLYCWSSL